jgi:hypothetical protein
VKLTRRIWITGAVPLAVAALYGGSVAFADNSPAPSNGSDTSGVLTQQPSPTAPAAPTDPGTPPGGGSGVHDSSDCPNMGGSGGSSDSSQSGTSTQTRLAPRSHTSSARY